MKKSVKFSPEVRERAVRMVFESRPDHPSFWAAVELIAAKIGCTAQTLHNGVRQHERGTGQQDKRTTCTSVASRLGCRGGCEVSRRESLRDPATNSILLCMTVSFN